MKGSLLIGAVWGLGAFVLVVYALRVRQVMAANKQRDELGGDVVDFLTQLAPRIDAPVIRPRPPTLQL